MVDTFHTSISAGMIGARRELMYLEQLAHGGRQASAKLRSIIGQEGGRASPHRDVAVHQNVCGAFGGEFGRGNGEHVRATVKAVREEKDIRVPSSRCRQRPKVVNTDGDARAVRKGEGEDWPANRLAGDLTRLIFKAAAHPPFCAGFHTNPPVEAFKHFESARNTEMTGGISVACVHDPRSGQERHIDANGVIKRRPSKTDRRTIWSGGSCNVVADKQYSIVVTLDQAAFGGEIKYVCGIGTLMRGKVVA